MNSFTFLRKLKSIFTGNTPQPSVVREDAPKTSPIASAIPSTAPSLNEKAVKQAVLESPLMPNVVVSHPQYVNIIPSGIRPELPPADDNSLENYGLEQCSKSDGNTEVLIASLSIILQNYMVEAKINEEDLRKEFTKEIDQTNYKIIDLNNQIANIQNEQIPEQHSVIEKYQKQMLEIEQRAADREEALPETYTIAEYAVANAKNAIKILKQKINDYKREIDKNKYFVDSLEKRSRELNLANPNILDRRKNVFFNGWVMGLQGLGWSKREIQTHKEIFE